MRKFIVIVCNKDASGRQNSDDYQLVIEARDRTQAAQKARATWTPRFHDQPKPRITVRLHD